MKLHNGGTNIGLSLLLPLLFLTTFSAVEASSPSLSNPCCRFVKSHRRDTTTTTAFQLPSLLAQGKKTIDDFASNIFGGGASTGNILSTTVEKTKKDLLETVSFTGNGKSATVETQRQVLDIVQKLETDAPTPNDIFTGNNPNTLQKLDGTWFLQYTSPSVVGEPDQFPDAWKPDSVNDEEGLNIDTRPYAEGGTVQASGIRVETSRRVVKQIFNLQKSTISNQVELDFGTTVRVSGTFRPSDSVARRVLVCFDSVEIQLLDGKLPTLQLGFLFAIRAFLKKTDVSGWLETTFLDDDIRIGRGNRGTMFVLTRDYEAVQP